MNIERIRIGLVVKRHREKRKLNQVQLAKKWGVAQSKVSRVETGKLGLTGQDAHRLMEVLKMDPSEIFVGIRRRRK